MSDTALFHRVKCGCLGILSLSVVTVWAADPSAQPAPAKAMETNAFATLTAQEMTLSVREGEITARLIEINRSMHDSRIEVIGRDAEIKALALEIEQKQAALEKMIADKYPKLGDMTRERERLVQEHSRLRVQLMDVRKQREEMAAGAR